MSKKDDVTEEIPEKLYDVTTGTTYRKLRFFGKVSFSQFNSIFDDFLLNLNL